VLIPRQTHTKTFHQASQSETKEPEVELLQVALVMHQGDHYIITGFADMEAKPTQDKETWQE